MHQVLPVILSNIVTDKEMKLKEMMKMMGLKTSVYWAVQYTFGYVIFLLVILMFIISGLIFQMRIFTINAFGSYFFLFIVSRLEPDTRLPSKLWGHVLVAMTFLFSVFFSKRKTASVVGYFFVLGICLVCAVVVGSLLSDPMNTDPSLRFGLSVIPSFALYVNH